LLLLGTAAHHSISPRPAVIQFEPGHSPLPPLPGRVPLPKKRLFLPPMLAMNEHSQNDHLLGSGSVSGHGLSPGGGTTAGSSAMTAPLGAS
jgi:hypothetical protein